MRAAVGASRRAEPGELTDGNVSTDLPPNPGGGAGLGATGTATGVAFSAVVGSQGLGGSDVAPTPVVAAVANPPNPGGGGGLATGTCSTSDRGVGTVCCGVSTLLHFSEMMDEFHIYSPVY